MSEQEPIEGVVAPTSQITKPPRALHRKYMEPIFYLADRMCAVDGEVAPNERRVLEELSEAGGVKAFRTTPTFRHLTVDSACKSLDMTTAKNGAMVIMTLLLKADAERREAEHRFFSRVRETLGMERVVVPVDFDEHKSLALAYLRNS
jgi:hypothetical protein